MMLYIKNDILRKFENFLFHQNNSFFFTFFFLLIFSYFNKFAHILKQNATHLKQLINSLIGVAVALYNFAFNLYF